MALVGEVEDKLLKFVMNFSDEDRLSLLDDDATSGINPQGPALESVKVKSDNVATSQDDVDDLLASLGF